MNLLAAETSPYLRQHADNPVHWRPWNAAALAEARRTGKPILLSIGYSACHWCHVMAHESFEDPATAEVMNREFVNIKVDREERPDLDRIYQAAHHFIAQRGGGWPLTMFLTPDEQVPFFGGTYFPNTQRYGMPSFVQVLERVAQYWRERAGEVRGQAEAMRAALAQLEPVPTDPDTTLEASPLAGFRAIAGQHADREHGGFGGAPKFPHPTMIERLLRHWRGTADGEQPDREALYLVALSLQRMAEGGIHDHVGGGFCRYAVDRSWTIPHFEKMLYDNGPLLALYAQLFQVSGDDTWRRVANGIADWALREMRAPDGTFHSSLDADSEGEEGKFYVWRPDEVRALLDDQEYAVVAPRFGLDQPPNFHEPHHDWRAWHLRVQVPLAELANQLSLPPSTVQRLSDSALLKLRAARASRVWPGLDDKILTSWNALMIRGLAIAGRALGRDELIAAAARALDTLRVKMVVDGRLLATAHGAKARLPAYLDDHAFLLDAVLELLQSRWDTEHLSFAVWLADALLDRFEAQPEGGFWFTAHDHEVLLHRSRPMGDEAVPSGNGIAAGALGRLGWLLGETRYLESAERTLRAGWQSLRDSPHGHCSLLNALEDYLEPPELIIIRGTGAEAREWARAAQLMYDPRRLVFCLPANDAGLPPALASKKAGDGVLAYVCRGPTCGPPIRIKEELVPRSR